MNIALEVNGVQRSELLAKDIPCENEIRKEYSWLCNIQPNINEEYPVYRIKIMDASSDLTVAYSNYFKISVSGEEMENEIS